MALLYPFYLLLLCSVVSCQLNVSSTHHTGRASSASTPPSVYDSFSVLLSSFQTFRESLSEQYREMVGNDTSALVNWIAYSNLLKPINSALLDSLFPTLTASPDLAISNACFLTLLDFAQAINQQQSWAYRILDSNGNFFPSGFMGGSFSHLGEFDQCLETFEQLTSNQVVEGQYCLLKYNIHVPTNKSRLLSQDVIFNTSGTALQNTFFADLLKYGHVFKVRSARIGICLPSVCTQSDIQTLVDTFLSMDKVNMRVDSCQTLRDYGKYSTLQLVILGVLASLLLIVVSMTIVELATRPKCAFLFSHQNVDFFVKSFSAVRNMKSLMSTTRSDENLRSINGIRVLTMCWLVYAHAYFLSIKETFRASSKFIDSIYDLKMYFILNAWPAVEVFFIISALIHSNAIFSVLSTTRKINIPKLIIHRVARMWPNIWLAVGLVFLVPSLAQGPLWPDVMKQQVDSCDNTWWKVPLFVSNFRSTDETCQVHTWYLSVDTQLYVLSFICIVLFYKYGKKAIVGSLFMSFFLCLFTAFYFYRNHHVPTILFNNVEERQIYEDMANVYMPTYFHLTPYLVGLIVGYALNHAKKRQIYVGKFLNLFLWFICLTITVGVILSGYFFTTNPYGTSLILQSLYAGYHRLIWSVAVSYLIFACENKQGGIISQVLSHPVFVPLSRLSYLVYLIHFVVTWARTAYIRSPLVYSNYTLLNEFIVNLVFSLVLALVFYLLVEAPFNKLYMNFIDKHTWFFGEIYLSANRPKDMVSQDNFECRLVMPISMPTGRIVLPKGTR